MKKYISFSGGVESSAMCVLFGGKADAIFSDAGWEHKQIYERIELVERRVREVHGNDFKVHRIKAKAKHKGEYYDNLKDYIRATKYYPSPLARYCTRLFKIEPIDNFLKDQGEVELMIGLNFDEQDRTGNHGLLENVNYSYPLIDNKITRSSCLTILDHAGLKPTFPPYMKRGGCVGCFYKSRKEYYAMVQLSPNEFKEVEDIENYIQDTNNKFYSIRKGETMKDLRLFAESSMFKPEELYNDYDLPETPCGVFCNR